MGFHDRGVTAGQCHEALDEVIDEPFMMEKSELTDGALRERWPEMLFTMDMKHILGGGPAFCSSW
jgi:hypothetical protein